jgi:hypothetical protein
MTSPEKRLSMHRFEVARAVRTAHEIAVGDISGDTQQAVRDLAHVVAALAQAIDELLERQEHELLARV